MHHVPRPKSPPIAGADEFPCPSQYKSTHKTSTQSKFEKKNVAWKRYNFIQHTSDNDLTGGLTASSQHLESNVKSTNGGGTPSL